MKRFTETEKWRDPWFRRLPHTLKLGYLYLLDSVDNAGVWDPDFDAADFCIGSPVSWTELMTAMGDRLEVLPNGKWHVTKFVGYQYGPLSEACKPHAQVIRMLGHHGIKDRVSKGYPKGIHTLKDKDKDKDKDTEGPKPDMIETIYAAYPRKVAKQDALKAIAKAALITPTDVLLEAVQAYAAATSQWSDADRAYIPHPATWFNGGRYNDDRDQWKRGTNSTDPIITLIQA